MNDFSDKVVTVEKDVPFTVTNEGFVKRGYVVIGWNTMNFTVVRTAAHEAAVMKVGNYYPIGSTLTPAADMTLYAIWAIDADNNGYPDYGGVIVRPQHNKELVQRMMSEVDFGDDGVSLRSAPDWNNRYDLPAFDDSIYYVGCLYNQDPANQIWENLIYMSPKYCFNGKGETTVAKKKMNLVIGYDGVLEDGCMIGGPKFQSLKTIEITQDMVNSEYILESLLNDYPFMFNAIQKDGQGILKMWFEIADKADVNYGKKPDVTSGTYFGAPGGGTWLGGVWGEPFLNPETGQPDSVLTIKFNIYNKPKFESPIISQRVDTAGRIDLKLVSGTPVKYMMRRINDFRWRPADSPLTNAERDEIWNQGATICLREMDRTIGHQMFLKEFYFTDDFYYDRWDGTYDYKADGVAFFNDCFDAYFAELVEYHRIYDAPGYAALVAQYDSWADAFSLTPLGTFTTHIPNAKDGPLSVADHYMCLDLAFTFATPLTPAYIGYTAVETKADSTAAADWYTVYAVRKAAAIPVPDPCRGTFCLNFESKPLPGIQRQVYMPQVDGVTTNPEYGAHYIPSQDDFNFTAKYTTANPMKVTTNRIINGVEEVLQGTLNEKGEYEYVIHKVTQNIVLTFSPGSVDNASIDGIAVWSYNNTINIRVAKEDVASIYSIAGQMVKRIELSEGDNPIPMERGVYIVTLKDGAVHKVTVK